MKNDALPAMLAVLDAARRLLAARQAGAETRDAWDALRNTVAVARAVGVRREAFAVEGDWLVHRVAMPRGPGYWRRCHRRDFLAVAHAVGARRGAFTVRDLAAAAGVTRNAALVAMVFLKRRGLVVRRGLAHAAAAGFSVAAAGAELAGTGRVYSESRAA